MKTNPDDQAFPLENSHMIESGMAGFTKREYFASLALQGMLANSFKPDNTLALSECDMDVLSTFAVQHADYLIDELNK